MSTTYSALVGAANAEWLASEQDGPHAANTAIRIRDAGFGTVEFDEATFAALADLPDHHDGVIGTDEDGNGACIWIEGIAYAISVTGPEDECEGAP